MEVTLDELPKKINPKDILIFGYIHSGLNPLFEAFATFDLSDIEIFLPFLRLRSEDLPNIKSLKNLRANLVTPLPIPEISGFISDGVIDVIYLPYSKIIKYILNVINKRRRVWLFCEITPPENGEVNTGYVSLFPKELHEKCITVGIINPEMPKTFGDSELPANTFNYFVEIPNISLPLYDKTKESDTSKKIAEFASELIDNDSCIQLGVGSTIPPLIRYLREKENLKVHTGLFHQRLAELVDKGVIKGKCSASVAVPISKDFYKWLHLNPYIEIRDLNHIYNPMVIAQIPKFVAVNSAVTVDLQGQVVATTIGSRVISGIGGLLDFCKGAKLSKNGKSIIVIESTHKRGSRIRPMIAPGDTVSLTSYDVDYIVTEYGVAKVGENSRKKIAEELISVAHPDYQRDLREGAKKLNLI